MDTTAQGQGGLVSELHEAANSLARKAWRAKARGTGMHLTADEVLALHETEGDGEWWQSFSPDHPNISNPEGEA